VLLLLLLLLEKKKNVSIPALPAATATTAFLGKKRRQDKTNEMGTFILF
jgi:hypothetical protein